MGVSQSGAGHRVGLVGDDQGNALVGMRVSGHRYDGYKRNNRDPSQAPHLAHAPGPMALP
jgi:hypothetical protein